MRSAKVWLARLGLAMVLAALAAPAQSLAARNPLDPSFGQGGIELTPAPAYQQEGEINALARDAKGRIVAVGQTSVEEFALLRYRANGSLDPTLDGDRASTHSGIVTTGFAGEANARAVAIQPDGKIVVAGSNSQGSGFLSLGMFALARYRPNGSLDPSFGRGGRVLDDLPGLEDGGAFAMGLQSGGRILAGGFHEIGGGETEGLLVRYKPDGSVDRSFGHGGEAALTAKRKGGHVWVTSLRVLPDDRILVAGEWNGHFLLTRLLPDGRPDPSFGGGDGRVVTDVDGTCNCGYADALSLWRGHILLAGNSIEHGHRFAIVARYQANGTLDRSFGARGIVRIHRGTDLAVESIALSADGRITLPGYYASQKAGPQVAALRMLPSGKPDRSFGRSGLFTHNFSRGGVALTALAQPDGKVIIAGRAAVQPPHFPESESTLDGAQFMLMRFR